MVVKMMRWRPWPPLFSKKFEVKLVLLRMDGFHNLPLQEEPEKSPEMPKLMAEVRWKGPKLALSSLRRTVKRNFTKEESLLNNGSVEWNEEFRNVCNFSAYKENAFLPWEIVFTVFNEMNSGLKNKVQAIGTALLNVAEFAVSTEEKELEIDIPVSLAGVTSEPLPTLHLALSFLELRTAQESPETVQRAIVAVPLSPPAGEVISSEKDELSALKAGLRKVKILTEFVSTRRSKKACYEEESSEGRCSARSEDAEYTYPFDTDSLDEIDDGELDEGKEDSSFRKSFSYGTLASANCMGGSYFSEMKINGENEDWIYYSNRKSDVGSVNVEETSSVSEQSRLQASKRGILSWRKRKLSFRQLSSSDESFASGWHKADDDAAANRSSVSEFGDDNFAVGSWEQKEVISRDGQLKLSTQVFFASIDQRSERAAGESACTALVAVIADWLQNNQETLPIKSQFDSLIREGSLEWRNLCNNEIYRERFPDKHFDLETVLQAKIRPLSVVPEKSFIGFFHPDEGIEGGLDFLHGAMSFDNIWDEISCAGSCCSMVANSQVYIVSWNDHFFVLKVEPDAFYIVDTLGERLYEGCNQAYILKFDRNTTIYKLPNEGKSSEEKPESETGNQAVVPVPKESVSSTSTSTEETGKSKEEEEVVCQGKEACKEYIKNFLAAIPIRELQVDIKKGLMSSTPIHHRLQIEFHLTEFNQAMITSSPLTSSCSDSAARVETTATITTALTSA
ncbi:hypothetical protein H6P81_016598 [Aristolochia fimbriata]|uniref:C2 NT-type domain-containing protein n=1 Tax=Aristolochia fimbriata TaxID=158543 RepID=A0AAV7E959_ARIFI|nr:hypothetical protein H6P81_016598 [Aristolochia fimbriata]